MSLRSLLNDEPQDPISALPPRTPTTSSNLPSLVTSSPSTPLRTNPSNVGVVPFPAYDRPTPSASPRFPNGDAFSSSVPLGFNEGSPKRPRKKSRVYESISHPNGHEAPGMEVDVPLNGAPEESSYGSTGRSNLTGRTSPRPRAYSSDLETPENAPIWQQALSKYMLKTRTKQHDIARLFASHTHASNLVLGNSVKSNIASRIVKIQTKERQERMARAAGRPYASLVVGGVGGLGSEYGASRAGSDDGYGYGYDEEDELRGDDLYDGARGSNNLAVPTGRSRGWDASTAPSADEADASFVSAPSRRRRKALLDPMDDGDADSVGGGDPSIGGTPKRNKRRKVETAGKTAISAGTGASGAKGAPAKRKPARRSNRGRMIGGGVVGLEDWSVPYPDLGPPPPQLPIEANQAISFKSDPALDGSLAPVQPVTEEAYNAAFNPIWASIVNTSVPYAFKARANHVAAVKIVHERVSRWCVVAAQRGWGGEYTPVVPPRAAGGAAKDKDLLAGGRFGRDPVAKARKLQRELLTFWKKNEKEERDERRRREKERVEKARAELEKKEEQRQRRKLEFLITQTELYSHFVGKRLQSECTGSFLFSIH